MSEGPFVKQAPKMVEIGAGAPRQGTSHDDIKALADNAVAKREHTVLKQRAASHALAIGTILGEAGYSDDRMKDTALVVARDLLDKLAEA